MFYDKFRNNNRSDAYAFLDSIEYGHDNMHLAWRDLYNEFVERNNPLDLRDAFGICKTWNLRKGMSELEFFSTNIDWLIEVKKELIDFYHNEYQRDGDESNIETVIGYRFDIVKLRNLSSIHEIKDALKDEKLL